MNREQMLSEITTDNQRVQYDGEDEDRIFKIAQSFTEASMQALEALAAYQQALIAPVSETSADEMKKARYDAVFAWTILQAATSKIAYVLRIDGDEAYKKAVAAAIKYEDPDLSGL